ncbi:hypothetical protein [Streptomyces sp. NPDC027717]|uniref:hypothetical protein n=1 Tax=Streptomyces sp. NPDC027717 TaxID=3155765 RepID=UPI0033E51221
MTLYGIPPAGMRRAMAPESGRDHAHAIADAAHAWWTSNRGGSSDRAIAVGTLAGLALSAPSRPEGPDYGPLLLPLNDEQLIDALRAGWNSFWTYDPDLTEAARPLHDWLSNPTETDIRGLSDYARVLVRAGLLEYCSDTARAESDDILGLLITRMRSYSERQSTGEFFTPAVAADHMGDILFSNDRRPGDLFLEAAAGTGTMARAAAATMRFFGTDPAEYRWWLNDLDPLNAACCAVSAQLWRLGQHVTVSCGDALNDPRLLEEAVRERAERATAEQQARPVLYPTRTRPPFWPWQSVPPF